jgi:hypothetical protein
MERRHLAGIASPWRQLLILLLGEKIILLLALRAREIS